MREFDIDTIMAITAFEKLTGTSVRDCVRGEKTLYFLVNPGKAAIAIGKGGRAIKAAEEALKRPIRIFEWAEKPEQFVKNMVPAAHRITIANGMVTVALAAKDRGAVIGKSGSNIHIINDLLARNSALKELKIL